MRNVRLLVLGALALAVLVVTSALTGASPGTTTRVSVPNQADQLTLGNEGNGQSSDAAISGDGRYVAFRSTATNLVPGDTNAFCDVDGDTVDDNCPDVFVHDRQTGVTTRVSVDSAGAEANWESNRPAISGDGRYVAFESFASNLVAGDTNAQPDVFVHDRQTGATTRASVDSAGDQGNSGSEAPAISADGRHVAFYSSATNLVGVDTNGDTVCDTGCDTNATWDIFVHDRQTGITTRVSVGSGGQQADAMSCHPNPDGCVAISADGRHVAFQSGATNLVAGDKNATWDVFVHDTCVGAGPGCSPSTIRVSTDSNGDESTVETMWPAISADGRYVAFTFGYMGGDVLVRDTCVGAGPGCSPSTVRVSVDSAGVPGNKDSMRPAIGADGRYVAFQSLATDLVANDTNVAQDVFVHDTCVGAAPGCSPLTARVSVDGVGKQGNGSSESPAISANGGYVAFQSEASNLVPGDTNGTTDVFVHDRLSVGDSDSDGWADSFENYLGTDPLDACPDNTSDPAWPLDQNNDGFILVVGDVTMYSGKLFTPVTCPSADPDCRLDLDANGVILVVGDVTQYSGRLFETCT